MGLSGYHNCEDGASQKEAEIQDNPVREKYAIEQTQFFSLMDDINVSEKYAILQTQLSSYQCGYLWAESVTFHHHHRGFSK